jgi:uncharacterized pyridoxamine 5'-phosphate oxidase family protein
MDEAVEILRSVPFGALATADEHGAPHVVPVHFAADDTAIYWFSKREALHSRNLDQNPAMSFAVWTLDRIPILRGVYLTSVGRRMTEEFELERGKTVFAEKFPEIPEAFVDYEMYTASLGEIHQSKSSEYLTYLVGGVVGQERTARFARTLSEQDRQHLLETQENQQDE